MIEYAIVENSRSKRPSLQITPHDGLVVVIPPRYKKEKIPTLLKNKKDWIEKNLQHWHNAREEWGHTQNEYPSSIELKAFEQTWQITYKENAPAVQQADESLTLNISAWEVLLKNWCEKQAKDRLPQLLESVSKEIGLPYKSCAIRNQKSRWGSCTSKGHINLNMKLIFLPPHLVKHIMIHELAHTIHMNHSSDFWNLVAKHDPNYKTHNAELKKALFYVPHWLQGSAQKQKETLEL